MKQVHMLMTILFTATLLFGSVLAQEEVEAINETRQQYVALYEQGDIEALLDFYTEDFIAYPFTGQLMEGRQAVREYLQQNMEAGLEPPSFEPAEIEVFDDTAYDLGNYTVRNAAGEIVAQGNYLVILKRVDGQWKLHRSINNVVLPEIEPGEATGG